MKPEDLLFEQTHAIRVHEAGPDGRISLRTLLNFFQEAAYGHAGKLGWGREALLAENVAWAMTRLFTRITRLPRYDERVLVRTWPARSDKRMAYRDFMCLDADGGELCRGKTAWVHFDLDTRKMASFGERDHLIFNQGPDSCIEFESRSVPKLGGVENEAEIIARRSDIDPNGHVNNTHFTSWALEAVEGNWMMNRAIVGLDIQLRSEVIAGDRVRSLCASGGDDGLLHSLVRVSDEVEVARARTAWKRV